MKFLAIIFFCLFSIFWYYISWYFLKENNNDFFYRQKELITAILLAGNFLFGFLLAKLIYKSNEEQKEESSYEKLKQEDFFIPEIKEVKDENIDFYEKQKYQTKDNIDIILDEREENYKHKINLKEEIIKTQYKNLIEEKNKVDIIDNTFKNVADNLKKQSIQDLKIIEGIGPKIEKILNSNGIYSYKDLKNTEVDKLKNILEKANKRYLILHNPITWSKQAKLADDNKFEELKKYQDKLVKGIEK